MPIDHLYIGTHRRAHRTDSEDVAFGIYSLQITPETGRLRAPIMTATDQPGWIDMHPTGRFLYAVNEVSDHDGEDGGAVSAFAVDGETGALHLLNTQCTLRLPCHCEVAPCGRFLLVATFGGGSLHVYALGSDGRIGLETDRHHLTGRSVDPRRQTQPHAHAVSRIPGTNFVLVPDLGTDQLRVFEFDDRFGRLVSRPELTATVAPGSGPRHVAFGVGAKFVYLMNEMAATIMGFAFDSGSGALIGIQTVDILPPDFAGHRSGAAIRVHPNGRYLYATTRSHGSSGEPPVRGLDTLVWYQIDQNDGRLEYRGRVSTGGEIPRSFDFDAEGRRIFIGHQCTGTVVSLQIDRSTGAPAGEPETFRTPVPVCVRFVPGVAGGGPDG